MSSLKLSANSIEADLEPKTEAIAPGRPTDEAEENLLADADDPLFDDDCDFDVEDDVAFVGEDYDVLDLDDVLELCDIAKRDRFEH
jgi:hypothetical protein